MLGYFAGFWESWDSGHKVTFDPRNRLILINEGITYINVKEDLYSAWKEWLLWSEINNRKYLPAITAIGGQPISDTQSLGSTFFLINSWKIKPWDGHSNIIVEGNLYVDEGGRPVIPDNNGNDSVSFIVSTLVETIIIDNSGGADDDAPVWDGPIGIIDAYQDGKFITARWSAAQDANNVRYKVYISNNVNIIIDDNTFYGSFTGNLANINTEADGVTDLIDQDYFIAVTAIDNAGNETDNTNYATVNFDTALKAPITVADIWNYSTQTNALANLGLTPEQSAKLDEILLEIVTENKKTRNTVIAVS